MSAEDENLEALITAEKERLSVLRYAPLDLAGNYRGVLVSQQIKYLSDEYDLISPFDDDCLRPAGYDLTVGERFEIGGELRTLGSDGVLTIPPYRVAVIQTFETLNVPDFLIGRWNIRVKLAYEGLLWVGGAQVDPGFRGRLSCPIYNLSQAAVDLKFGQKLAMIDFVATSTSGEVPLKPFQWWTKSVVFQQYNTSLQSGIAEQVRKITEDIASAREENRAHIEEKVGTVTKTFSQSIREVQTRMDTFLTLIFTVVAILFAGLGIVATKGSNEDSFVSSTVWIAAVALYFACRPWVVIFAEKQQSEQGSDLDRQLGVKQPLATNRSWYSSLLPSAIEILLALIIVFSGIGYHLWNARVSSSEIHQARKEAAEATDGLKRQKQDFQTQLDQLRVESDTQINSLQQKVDLMQKNQCQNEP